MSESATPDDLIPPVASRRAVLKGIAAAGGAALTLSDVGQRLVSASTTRITKANAADFTLKEIAKQKGKTIAIGASGINLQYDNRLGSVIADNADRMEDDGDLLWQKNSYADGQLHPINGGFRPTPSVKDINWYALDIAIDFAQKQGLSFGAQSLIFGDMGAGQSTTKIQRVPAWLIGGGYSYKQAIQIGNDHVQAVLAHLQEKGIFDPMDDDAGTKLRVGVLNEFLNDSVELYRQSQSKGVGLDDSSIWFKGASYWQDQANKAGDAQPIPQYIKAFLLTAKRHAGRAKIGVSDYAIETWNDYRGDPSGGTPNQKTQVMYNFIKALKDDPDLKMLIDGNFYVGMQAHWYAKDVLDAGADRYAADVEATVKRFRQLGVDVILTETTVAEYFLQGSGDERDRQAAEVWGKVPVAALRGGASELTIFEAHDIEDVPYWDCHGSIFYERYQKKPGYAALAEGLASLPDKR